MTPRPDGRPPQLHADAIAVIAVITPKNHPDPDDSLTRAPNHPGFIPLFAQFRAPTPPCPSSSFVVQGFQGPACEGNGRRPSVTVPPFSSWGSTSSQSQLRLQLGGNRVCDLCGQASRTDDQFSLCAGRGHSLRCGFWRIAELNPQTRDPLLAGVSSSLEEL